MKKAIIIFNIFLGLLLSNLQLSAASYPPIHKQPVIAANDDSNNKPHDNPNPNDYNDYNEDDPDSDEILKLFVKEVSKKPTCDDVKGASSKEITEYNKRNNLHCEIPINTVAKKYVIIFAIILLIIIAIRIFFETHKPKLIEPVEFYAPNGIDPIELGYYVDGNVDDRDIVAMFLYFVQKGYVKIEKKGQHTKLIKLQEIDPSETAYAKKLFQMMFFDNKVEFDPVDVNIAFAQNYKGLKTSIIKELEKEKSLYSKASIIAKRACLLIAIVEFLFMSIFLTSNKFIFNLLILFFIILCLMSKKIVEYSQATNKEELKTNGIIFSFVCLVFIGFSGVSIAMLYADFILGILMASIITTSILIAMGIRNFNPEYTEIIGRARGFRNFLANTEMEKFNTLVEDNPNYYFDILPYIYALGLSNKFIEEINYEQFENMDWANDKNNSNNLDELLMFGNTYFDAISNIAKMYKFK